jgi:hypothetical protein
VALVQPDKAEARWPYRVDERRHVALPLADAAFAEHGAFAIWPAANTARGKTNKKPKHRAVRSDVTRQEATTPNVAAGKRPEVERTREASSASTATPAVAVVRSAAVDQRSKASDRTAPGTEAEQRANSVRTGTERLGVTSEANAGTAAPSDRTRRRDYLRGAKSSFVTPVAVRPNAAISAAISVRRRRETLRVVRLLTQLRAVTAELAALDKIPLPTSMLAKRLGLDAEARDQRNAALAVQQAAIATVKRSPGALARARAVGLIPSDDPRPTPVRHRSRGRSL